MTAEVTTDDGLLMVAPSDAEVDLLTCPQWHGELLRALERADCRVLIVDLSRVVFFGASGLGVLADVRDRSAQCGVELRLIVCSRPVRRALEVTGLTGSFAVYRSRADALTCGLTR